MLARLKRAIAYGRAILQLKRDDVLLASFPKSGSTWIRFLLRNYIELEEGGGEVVGFREVDGVMLEFGRDDLGRPWPYRCTPRFVKTHTAWRQAFRGRRSILVVRDPRDVMVSWYHFEKALIRPRFTGDFPEFVKHHHFGLEAWFRHTRSWLRNATRVVRYADMRSDDAGTFERLFDSLAIARNEPSFGEAVVRSRFDHVRSIENERGHPAEGERFRTGWRFLRDGSVGGWTAYFAPEQLAHYEKLMLQYPDVVSAVGLQA